LNRSKVCNSFFFANIFSYPCHTFPNMMHDMNCWC
uniref:Ovule protein n=1 Tax=Brugia timori TaxID=42155 RepID=A0A0R3R0P2_9BILA